MRVAMTDRRRGFGLIGVLTRLEPGLLQHPPTVRSSPASRKFSLASGGSGLGKNQQQLGLAYLSKTPSGIFFPASPSWLGNGWPKCDQNGRF